VIFCKIVELNLEKNTISENNEKEEKPLIESFAKASAAGILITLLIKIPGKNSQTIRYLLTPEEEKKIKEDQYKKIDLSIKEEPDLKDYKRKDYTKHGNEYLEASNKRKDKLRCFIIYESEKRFNENKIDLEMFKIESWTEKKYDIYDILRRMVNFDILKMNKHSISPVGHQCKEANGTKEDWKIIDFKANFPDFLKEIKENNKYGYNEYLAKKSLPTEEIEKIRIKEKK